MPVLDKSVTHSHKNKLVCFSTFCISLCHVITLGPVGVYAFLFYRFLFCVAFLQGNVVVKAAVHIAVGTVGTVHANNVELSSLASSVYGI